MTPIIEVKGLSKKYRMGESQPYLTLRDSLVNFAKNPFKKIKKDLNKDDFWALKDINFTVEPGEVVGIVGNNGSGKSTLLKILSRITPPTEGLVVLRGKVGSLLEVGTGFHHELTGRENIFLNGAILGMKKNEVKQRLKAIINFAEINKFIDTPLKHYSTGMKMRLAFSVAAHLDPDILLVDEVLAVGDVDFQQKCLGKMGEVAKSGRTVILVSHDLRAIENLCNRVLYLEHGKQIMFDRARAVINKYLNKNLSDTIFTYKCRLKSKQHAQITSISILDKLGKASAILDIADSFSIRVQYFLPLEFKRTRLKVIFKSFVGQPLFVAEERESGTTNYSNSPYHDVTLIYKPTGQFRFNKADYRLTLSLATAHRDSLDTVDNMRLSFLDKNALTTNLNSGRGHQDNNLIFLPEWEINDKHHYL